MISKKHSLGIALLTFCMGCAGKAEIVHHTQPVKWVLSEGLCEPETVIHDKVVDTLIVSNICGFKNNGEGYLSILTRDGAMKNARWIDGLDAPAGMTILGRTLYVTDLDKVQVINLDRGRIVNTLGPFADAKAFNDLAVAPDGTLYIVRRHIKWHRFRPGLRETLLISLVDIKRQLCGIASVDV